VLVPEILRAVATTYGWNTDRQKELVIARITPAELAGLAGVYEVPGVAKLTVTAEGDRLYVSTPVLGSGPSELLPQGEGKFIVLANGVTAEFVKDASGVASKMLIGGPFGDFQAARIP
jgi:hypothetical protein